jgi:hypothetical protein
MPLSGAASGRPWMINLVSPRRHSQILLATFSWPKSTFLQLMSAFHATRGRNLGLENYAGRLIDYGVMLPRVQALYAFAAADLDEPRLLDLIRDGLPAYAWTNDEDHPWTTARSRRLRSVLTWLTSS